MNDSRPTHVAPPGERRRATDDQLRARAKAESWETYTNWLKRNQKNGGRHSAITRNLYSWSSYKSWAEKVRTTWSREK